MIDATPPRRWGACSPGPPWLRGNPITPSTSLMDAFKMFADRMRVDRDSGRRNFAFIQAEDELAAIGMVIGAMWNGARALPPPQAPASRSERVPGLAYYVAGMPWRSDPQSPAGCGPHAGGRTHALMSKITAGTSA